MGRLHSNANITDPWETAVSHFLFLALPVGKVTFFNAKATDSGGGGVGFKNPRPPESASLAGRKNMGSLTALAYSILTL